MKLHVDDAQKYLVIDECSQIEYDQLCISYNKEVKNGRFSPKYKNGTWDGKINFMKGKYLPATTYQYLFDICEKYGFQCEISNLDILFDNDIDFDGVMISLKMMKRNQDTIKSQHHIKH